MPHFLLLGRIDEIDVLASCIAAMVVGLTVMAGRRRILRDPVRVTQLWGRTVLDERTMISSVVVGHGPRADFATSDVGLPPLYTLFHRSFRSRVAFLGLVIGTVVLAAGVAAMAWINGARYILFELAIVAAFVTCFATLPRTWRLMLGPGMAGEIFIGGRKRVVGDILGEEKSRRRWHGPEWRAVLVGYGDWGVIRLGDEQAFTFQLPEPPSRLPTAAFQGSEYLWSAVLWTLTFHGILVGSTYLFSIWPPPGASALGGYVIHMSKQPPKLPEKKEEQKKEKTVAPSAGLQDGDVKVTKAAASQDKEGKQGGEGKRQRAATDKPVKDPIIKKVEGTGVLKYRDTLSDVVGSSTADARLQLAMARVGDAGFGPGHGTGVGPGTGVGTSTRGGGGPGGGGKSPYDVVSRGPIDTGTGRPPKGSPAGVKVTENKVALSVAAPEDASGGLTPEQVRAVVEKHRAVLQYCFEKELQRTPTLNGKVVVYWRIDPNGSVQTSKVRTSTVNNANVEDCLARSVQKWVFPTAANGQVTDVRYPFVFSSGR